MVTDRNTNIFKIYTEYTTLNYGNGIQCIRIYIYMYILQIHFHMHGACVHTDM